MDFSKIKHGLIVSCQSEGNDPFNTPEGVTLFAKAAVMGGAVAIRSQGFEKTMMITEQVSVPVIGLMKSEFLDGTVRITGSFEEVEQLIKTGCSMIAIDGTFREREGMTGPAFISAVKAKYNIPVMADVAEYQEGIACAEAGADCISTTLSGYTPSTSHYSHTEPDYELIERLTISLGIPIIAEGRINVPEYAAKAIEKGAYAVVVGTAISRPRVVTSWFAEAIQSATQTRG